MQPPFPAWKKWLLAWAAATVLLMMWSAVTGPGRRRNTDELARIQAEASRRFYDANGGPDAPRYLDGYRVPEPRPAANLPAGAFPGVPDPQPTPLPVPRLQRRLGPAPIQVEPAPPPGWTRR